MAKKYTIVFININDRAYLKCGYIHCDFIKSIGLVVPMWMQADITDIILESCNDKIPLSSRSTRIEFSLFLSGENIPV